MRVLIAAGGTAGHINPALAIAGALKKADPTAEIHFAGRKEGMEYRLVTQAGYPFHHIEITGFQRKLSLHNIKRNIITLWNLALSGPKAKAMMKEVKPDLVIGCGGYVSGPVVRCAAKMGIHTALHEQNAFPGVTNKLLAPDVDIVFAAVPAAVEKLGAPDKTLVVGNPVRPEVFVQAANREAIRVQLGAGDRTVILSFGGSLGARRVNEVVADLCAWEQHEHKPVLHLHATGQYGVQLFKDLEQQKGFAEDDSLVVKEYINNMPELLAAADLVISRAGALTLAELEAVGRAAVLIPSPNVAENHQYYNAMELQKAGAAVVIEEKDLTGEKLVQTVSEMLTQPGKLAEMGRNARSLSVDDSLDRIAAALQGTGPQLCNGCSLAVVFQRDTATASFAHQLPHLRAGVVQKCPAIGDIAGVGIHKAGQRHGDTVHFILMRCIQSVYCVEKMLLRMITKFPMFLSFLQRIIFFLI